MRRSMPSREIIAQISRFSRNFTLYNGVMGPNARIFPPIGRIPEGNMTSMAPVQRLRLLRELERKVLWLSAWTIHHANHIRPNRDGLKVGGHQASCASLA